MGTGYRGTFVISWSQIIVDGLADVPVRSLAAGSTWRWQGEATRVDGPADVLTLFGARGVSRLHERAAARLKARGGIAGASLPAAAQQQPAPGDLPEGRGPGFTLTDGARRFRAELVRPEGASRPLIVFEDEVPAPGTEYWIVESRLAARPRVVADRQDSAAGVICFTPGTRLLCARGALLIEELGPGDLVQTKDNGLRPVLWIGQRRLSGARLHAMPELRPVRIREGALGEARPDGDLIVSPSHRMLIEGPRARALFNTDEVFAKAADLIDGRTITRDLAARDVTYVHVMLEQHEVVFANGVETESFHPADRALDGVDPVQRERLFALMPGLRDDPARYGAHARRRIGRAEAAILAGGRR